jgi:shikimate kinase
VHNVYLVGFMGAGKSAVGRLLASRLGRSFIDLDEAVVARLGMTVREAFADVGEAGFRDAETAELECVASQRGLVVATGGGVFSSEVNRELIRTSGGVTVFLDPPWELIRERLGAVDPERPKWTDDAQAHDLYLARRPAYLGADLHVPIAAGGSPSEVAETIYGRLSELPCAC